MKLSNALDAAGYRLKELADPEADQDALTAMALAPYEIAAGKVFRVPAGKQILFSMPITFAGTGSIDLAGAMVEVH
jgi:hypothetical protein